MAIAGDGYYDILLVRKTGQGKSSTGNKLLRVGNSADADESYLRQFFSDTARFLRVPGHGEKKKFPVGKSTQSCTKTCKLLANDVTKVRVLDVPGFADTNSLRAVQGCGKRLSLRSGNLIIARSIARVQLAMSLKVKRVVYFLPNRDILEKADGIVQDELQVMNSFFGESFFKVMVVVVTFNPRRPQVLQEEDITLCQKAFCEALESATGIKLPSPSVISILPSDTAEEIERKVRLAEVIHDEAIPLDKFTEKTCAQCGTKAKTTAKNVQVCLDSEGEYVDYEDTMCHPTFIQKYSKGRKILGGAANIVLLGVPALLEYITGSEFWPGFTNCDEICPKCERFPGFEGCCKVGAKIRKEWVNADRYVTVEHDNHIKSEMLD